MSNNCDFDVSLELVRDAAASRRKIINPLDGAVGAIHRELCGITVDDDPDRLLERFTAIAAAALVAIDIFVEGESEEA